MARQGTLAKIDPLTRVTALTPGRRLTAVVSATAPDPEVTHGGNDGSPDDLPAFRRSGSGLSNHSQERVECLP